MGESNFANKFFLAEKFNFLLLFAFCIINLKCGETHLASESIQSIATIVRYEF